MEKVLKSDNSGYLKWIIFAIKVFFFISIVALIYHQTFHKDNISELISAFNSSISQSSPILILITIVLVPVNWILEALKWKTIVSTFNPTTLRRSIKIILGGLSVGILTPSRIGEYGGRFYMAENEERWKTISATFVGSLSQNLTTVIMGLIGASYLLYSSSIMNEYLATSIWYIASISIGIGMIIYYKIGFLQHMVRFLPEKWAALFDQHSHFLNFLSFHILNRVLILSFIRYLVYAVQYILLLHFFGIVIPPAEALATVSLLFLIQTGLPFPPIFDVLARGEIALTLWAFYTDNTIGILATAFGLWVINLILPALLGLIYVILQKD